MHYVVSYPRSGSNFLLENLKDYIEIKKDPTYGLSHEKCIIVLRNPIDAVVSGIIHNHATTKTQLVEKEYHPTLVGASKFYVDHINKYDLSKIAVYDFNDLISNPVGVFRSIVDFDGDIVYPKNLDVVYPINLRSSVKDHPSYTPLHQYAMQNTDIFTEANEAYLDALKYKYVII